VEPKLRAKIHDLVLKARELLMEEARSLLEGEYGLHADGGLEPAEGLPSLRTNAEAAETRRRLEQFLADEARAGLRGREAVDKLVKEVAFTHLNRLVAFKMMEARKLIRGTIDRGTDSNAFKYYLVEHPEDEALWKRGEVDEAYRHFLLWQCGQIAREIKILFDPDNLPSRLFPRPRALKELLQMLNDPDVSPAWIEDETIGWVYENFVAEELEEAFRQVRVSKRKFEPQDIPAVTQLFTPRWIVRFLVENTIGRTWLQMHPDSNLGDKLKYLVPMNGEIPTVPPKPVREITLLDPACGTMHFGLVAFDLFVEMYREEMVNAGKLGWPEKASVESNEDIPAAIIANNLYGIDIDLRAVQLSALTLYLKAKSLNKNAKITESNLACADIMLLDGHRLEVFLKEMAFTRPVYGRVIRSLWKLLKDANQLGSLLRLEEEIHALVEAEREALKKDRAKIPLFPDRERFADAYASEEDFFDLLGAQIVQAFDEFARRQASEGKDATYFAGEAVKGLKVLDIMLRRYNVVVTNPPYMSARKMNVTLKNLVADAYPEGKGDLYAAFIQRCQEYTAPVGRTGMLSMHSFMFISSYESLRKKIRSQAAIETLAHCGPGLFDVGNPGTLQTAAYVIRKEKNEDKRNNSIGSYFRLVKEPDAEVKRNAFETALAALKAGRTDQRVYCYRQGDFKAIPGSPWVYWIGTKIRYLFKTLPKLRDLAHPAVGQNTGDNFRFLRFWWEVCIRNIGFGCKNITDAIQLKKTWFPYMKGGSFRRWYGNQEYIVHWKNDGEEVKAYAVIRNKGRHWSRYLQNLKYSFRRGVTYSYLTAGTFSARLSPGGFIFDVAGSSLFPDDIPLVQAVLNSTFAAYALKLINPTINFQVGDLARLPVPESSGKKLTHLVEKAISLAKTDSEEDETTYDFITPPAWKTGIDDLANRHSLLAEIESEIDDEVYRLYGISAEDRSAIEAELAARASPHPRGARPALDRLLPGHRHGQVPAGLSRRPGPREVRAGGCRATCRHGRLGRHYGYRQGPSRRHRFPCIRCAVHRSG